MGPDEDAQEDFDDDPGQAGPPAGDIGEQGAQRGNGDDEDQRTERFGLHAPSVRAELAVDERTVNAESEDLSILGEILADNLVR